MPIMKLDVPSTVATAALQDWGTVGLPLSEPPCRLRGMKLSAQTAGAPETGVWECSPGRYRRQIRSAEVMHVISGEATFTPEDGPAVNLKAGDLFFFGPDTAGTWEILSTLRKVYVLYAPG